MKSHLFKTAVFLIGIFVSMHCNAQDEPILVPQTGFKAAQNKIAIVRVPADSFIVTGIDNKVYLRKALGKPALWAFSQENVQLADLSSLTATGEFFISIPGTNVRRFFGIYSDPYSAIADAAVKAFYYNRCSYSVLPEFGGKWERKAGHPDTKVYIHRSAVSEGRPEDFVISSPGGWYDAGDYNKYIVNSGISTYTMLLAFEMYPEFWKGRCLNIPESKNTLPDILDETLYNLRWMLTMQDADGGLYHKCTTLKFEGFIMPEDAHEKRYVVQKNTAASLDFAATMAHASVVLADFASELPGLADSCRNAAIKAWEWCKRNPAILYKQPSDVSTGAYGDRDIRDEWYWAGVEMALITNSAFPDSLMSKVEFKTPSWGSVAPLGLITVLKNGNKFNKETVARCQKIYFDYVNGLVEKAENSAYPVSLDFFAWGSNSDIANQGLLKMVAYSIQKDPRYLHAAINDMNYLTGVNPTGYCYITGIGEKPPKNIHHRPSAADNILDPVPGFLAGGPNTVVFVDCPNAKRSKLPALSYVDETCSYSTNEIAINWNSPLVFLSGAVSYEGNMK